MPNSCNRHSKELGSSSGGRTDGRRIAGLALPWGERGGNLDPMFRFLTVLLAVGVAVGSILAQERAQTQILFIAENDAGKVWANTSLTLQRTNESYLPIVVAVENKGAKSITLDRSSFFLTDLDEIVYVMPSVKEQRKNYSKTVIDYRMISYAGIPWEGWQWNRRLEPANFFPNLRASSGNTTRDRMTLRQRHAIVDLLYFERPRNLDRPFFLDIHPKKGWEIPIRLRIVLN